MKPAQLLQDLSVVGVSIQHPLVGVLGTVKVLLLLMDVTNLKPYIFLGQRWRWRVDDVFEALYVCQLSLIKSTKGFFFKGLVAPQDSDCTSAVACI